MIEEVWVKIISIYKISHDESGGFCILSCMIAQCGLIGSTLPPRIPGNQRGGKEVPMRYQ
jgi:hypothetical protein